MTPRKSALLVTCALLALSPVPQAAADAQPPASIAPSAHGFEDFCRSWMGKLAEREARNLAKAPARKTKSGVALAYTGYGNRALKCSARKSGVAGNPFIGKLVYYELEYERRGRDRAAALKSEPAVVSTMEILEIFRHDGSRWVY